MAQKLHLDYGYSYDNLMVLLGGWNAWLEKNATDATGYPIGTGSGSGGAAPATNTTPVATP
ncbi:MAG TPA: hypothetical protein VND68_12385 [Chloroflexia bacterium]|nr:hypothetical protein [Chloroflexia bacterium]